MTEINNDGNKQRLQTTTQCKVTTLKSVLHNRHLINTQVPILNCITESQSNHTQSKFTY